MDFMRATWSLAVYTFREGIRKKILIGFLILSILVIFGSQFLSAFMTEARGSAEGDFDIKLMKDVAIAAVAIFGMLITIFISGSVVPTEVENKVIYTVLSKPVRRFQYLLGKFIGVQLIVLINLGLMGVLFFIAIYAKQQVLPTLLLWALLLTYFEFLIVSAFTFAVSCAATSAVLPIIAGLFIYITGNLTEYLKDVQNRAGEVQDTFGMVVGKIAGFLHNILPNLRQFSLRDQIVHGMPNDPPRDVLIPQLVIYGLAYALAGYILAYWVFRRKEL